MITETSTYYIDVGRFDFITGTYDLAVYLENFGPSPLTGGAVVAETEANDTGATANDVSTSWRSVQYFGQPTEQSPEETPTSTDINLQPVTC